MSDIAAVKDTLKNAYQRWHDTRGDCIDEVLDVFADEIQWGSLASGAHPIAFTAKAIGKSEVRGYFDGLLNGWTMQFCRVDHMLAEGDRIVVIGAVSWINKATGKMFESPKADVWRFKDGLAVEYYEFYDTAGAFAAAS